MACHSRDLVGVIAECVVTIFGLEGVDVHRTVGGLRGDVLVQRIPCHTLDVVIVLSDLAYQCAGSSIVDAGNVVHASDDEIVTVWRPGKVVDLGARGAAHMLSTPALLVVEALTAEGGIGILGWHPYYNIAVVTG